MQFFVQNQVGSPNQQIAIANHEEKEKRLLCGGTFTKQYTPCAYTDVRVGTKVIDLSQLNNDLNQVENGANNGYSPQLYHH
mmetsp:Transcript_58028/g.86218  ORF Transcript_58028/g.86218 Transcript_58028/m.86218 type:complete len:81 (+) Transcript_58028:1232-1474(+)